MAFFVRIGFVNPRLSLKVEAHASAPLRTAYCCDKHGVACDHAALGCDRLCSIFGQKLGRSTQ